MTSTRDETGCWETELLKTEWKVDWKTAQLVMCLRED